MTDKMVNGILFIIAGLGSIAVYIVLGETGLLDKGHTEKIAAYTLVTIPLAFMMTRNVEKNAFIKVQTYIDSGLLLIVVGLIMGLVSDAINSAELSAESNSIGRSDCLDRLVYYVSWNILHWIRIFMYQLFPNWLSGLLSLASFVMFAYLAILSPEQLLEGQGFEPWKGISPCWFSRPVHSTALPSLRKIGMIQFLSIK